MKIWAIATIAIAITCAAAGHPVAMSVDMPLLRHVPSFALTTPASQNTGSVWDGRWEGTTVSGHPLVLELQLQGQRITGRLIVGKQSAKIISGKVMSDGFALTTGPIDGRNVDATGRYVGDAIELTVKGVQKPLTLTRGQ